MNYFITEERERIDKEIAQIKEQLGRLPKGLLYCKQNGNYVKWYRKSEGDSVYLPKGEIKEAAGLAQANYLSCYLEDLHRKRELIDTVCKQFSFESKAELFMKRRDYKNLLDVSWSYYPMNGHKAITDERIAAWMNKPYEPNPNYTEKLIHKTISGLMVRSKSEAAIANALTSHNIPFKYECPLEINGTKYYPDFTIFSPYQQTLVIWEHFGKMGDRSYRKGVMEKLAVYESKDIYSPKNLITTWENSDSPLSMVEVEHIISDRLE